MKANQRLAVTQLLFPQKDNNRYTKYNSKNRDPHLLLNRFDTDAGYPQQIIKKTKNTRKPKDFQSLNKRKIAQSNINSLENNKATILTSKFKLDPRKLLIYRKNEMQLKSQTKINIQRQLDLQSLQFTEPVFSAPKMMEQSFYRQNSNSLHRYQHDLTMSLKRQKEKKSISTYTSRFRNSLHYEGENKDLTLRKLNNTLNMRTTSQKTANIVKQKQVQEQKLDWSNKRRFKQIIIKLKQYNKIFQGTISQADVQTYVQSVMEQEEKKMNKEVTRQKKLMQKIQDFARQKKQDIVWRDYHHLNELQDLKKINPKFYDQLMNTRKKRFQLLRMDLKKIQKVSPQKSKTNHQIPFLITLENTTTFQMDTDPEEYVNNSKWLQQRQQHQRSYRSISKIDKLKLFLQQFSKVRLSAQLFGIPIDMVYFSMLQQPQPYSLQGSFLFFKAVSSNDLQTVQIFIEQFPKIVHQVDDTGRSALIVSTEYNYTQMSKVIIQGGLNLDLQSVKGVSALQNAVNHRNTQIVLMLLQRGASPWSKNFNILRMSPRDLEIYRLIKLARRLNLGMRTVKSCSRYAFWQSVKHIIREQIGIN